MARGWFVYNPGTVTGGVTATGNYTYIDHEFECTGSGVACTVYAYFVAGPGVPALGITHPRAPFSSNLISYLTAASAATQPLPLNKKPYVYIKAS